MNLEGIYGGVPLDNTVIRSPGGQVFYAPEYGPIVELPAPGAGAVTAVVLAGAWATAAHDDRLYIATGSDGHVLGVVPR
jgi:hypothetical protein